LVLLAGHYAICLGLGDDAPKTGILQAADHAFGDPATQVAVRIADIMEEVAVPVPEA
jgi:hypothetical protein